MVAIRWDPKDREKSIQSAEDAAHIIGDNKGLGFMYRFTDQLGPEITHGPNEPSQYVWRLYSLLHDHESRRAPRVRQRSSDTLYALREGRLWHL